MLAAAAGSTIQPTTKTKSWMLQTHRVKKSIQVNWQRFEILANGGDIDYVGASAVELIGPGESSGSYRQIVLKAVK